jgi:NAD(P)-dependent dehydrogenase (short-subunit alcohol dehydrogenase family)
VLDQTLLEDNREAILKSFGKLDVLLNAAGGNMGPANVQPDQTIDDLDIEAMKKVCELNIFGTVLPTKVFVHPMVEQKKGSIINFCSMSSFRPLTRVAGYGIAKAGIASWTQWLAGELATKYGDGIRVNGIAPGFILSNQNRTLLTNPDGSLTDRSHKILDHTPFGRFLEADELLGTLHYLASDASKGVTGTISIVDGGFNSFSI